MAVLEVLLLRLKKGIQPTNPDLLANLADVRSKLKTGSRWYIAQEDPSLLYILGLWPSLAAHKAFLSSPERADILAAQDAQVDFVWMRHVELDSMSSLPLDAPVMSIARMTLKRDRELKEGNTDAMEKYERAVAEASKPYWTTRGTVIDAEEEEAGREVLVFTGWEKMEHHLKFIEMVGENKEFEIALDGMEKVEGRHGRDLEKTAG